MSQQLRYSKILFLDVDGVLNTLESRKIYKSMRQLDPACVKELSRIVKETGCNIVLSSTWRLGGLKSLLTPVKQACIGHKDRAKIIIDALIDRTPVSGVKGKNGGYPIRGDEIQAWMTDNNFTGKFAIVDDDSDMGDLLPYLIKTHNSFGLTTSKADDIIKLLS